MVNSPETETVSNPSLEALEKGGVDCCWKVECSSRWDDDLLAPHVVRLHPPLNSLQSDVEAVVLGGEAEVSRCDGSCHFWIHEQSSSQNGFIAI